MTERISCDCINVGCKKSNEDIFEFDIHDSFKLVYIFKNNKFSPNLFIPLDSFDLTITYYIKDREEKFIAEKIGRKSTNCILYPEKSKIKVIFDNHGLQSGLLYADFKFKYFDPEMVDRNAEQNITKFTNIILKDNSESYG